MEWYCKPLKDICNYYKQYTTIKKTKLKSMLQLVTNLFTTKKVAYLSTLPEDITEVMFVKFLRIQTLGADYINYDYLLHYYNIQVDTNYMPIFTETFSFDRQIKKEALFIWSIKRNIENDKHLINFNNLYMELVLQDKLETNDISEIRKMSFDMHWYLLDIIVEIDENHNTEVLINDDIKNAIMQQNGINYLRMNFQNIYDTTIITNINTEIYNNTYYTNFIKSLMDLLLYKLLKKNRDVREYYVMYLFRNSLYKKAEQASALVIKYNNKKTLLDTHLLTLNRERNIQTCLIKIKNNNIDLQTNIKIWQQTNTYINNLFNASNFIALFNYKDRCKLNNNRVITFTEVISLLNILPENIIDFKQFLLSINVINTMNRTDKNILLNWKQLCFTILNYQ